MASSVKVLPAILPGSSPAEKPVWKPLQGFMDHIKGVIAADIMPFR
jgi:hypothetical protein